jgi:hypothetical protein
MSAPLPPDLSRLGDALARATDRQARARRRRSELTARIAATGAAAALAFAVLHPGALGTAERSDLLQLASADAGYVPVACDQPRGATFAAVRPCGSPGTTDVAQSSLARRYAVH